MRIAISGNSGFIGQHLTEFLSAGGDVVVPLKHAMFRSRSDEKLKQALTGCDVVINLAGATINQRWTRKAKRKIMNSRIYTTRRLVSIINEMEVKPKVFISASAVGIYPDNGIYSESSTSVGTGFLSDVCIRWEDEAQKLSRDIRLVVVRFGVVLSKDGGALPKMLLPFRFFVGALLLLLFVFGFARFAARGIYHRKRDTVFVFIDAENPDVYFVADFQNIRRVTDIPV